MPSDVMTALRALQTGDRDLGTVVQMFRTRKWPLPPPRPKDAAALFKAEQTDTDPPPPGSFSEVAGAYYQGIITADQYAALQQAAAEAIAAQTSAPDPTATDTEEPLPSEADAPSGTSADPQPDDGSEVRKADPGVDSGAVTPDTEGQDDK